MPLEAWLLLSGIILLIIEVIIPGFGIFGISGLFLPDSGLVLPDGRRCSVHAGSCRYVYYPGFRCFCFSGCICLGKASGTRSCCGRSRVTAPAIQVVMI